MYSICLECDEKIDICITTGKYRIECCEQARSSHTFAIGRLCESKEELLQTYLKMCKEHEYGLCYIYDGCNKLIFQGILNHDNYLNIKSLIQQ